VYRADRAASWSQWAAHAHGCRAHERACHRKHTHGSYSPRSQPRTCPCGTKPVPCTWCALAGATGCGLVCVRPCVHVQAAGLRRHTHPRRVCGRCMSVGAWLVGVRVAIVCIRRGVVVCVHRVCELCGWARPAFKWFESARNSLLFSRGRHTHSSPHIWQCNGRSTPQCRPRHEAVPVNVFANL
jgi:hypothetical protein